MNLFFEEDGAFKTGNEMSATDSACQVELPSGKRIKVKKSHVLVTFTGPAPAEFLQKAQEEALTLDLDLLWEFAPEEEFGFEEIAKDYYGELVTPLQKAAVILRLHANPVYFYRKGRGRYKKAPEETLKLALAAIEKKKRLEAQKDEYVRILLEEKRAPEEIAKAALDLLTRPDKNSVEWKALNEASNEEGVSPLRLLLSVGAIANEWRWHVGSFFKQNFPAGVDFPKEYETPAKDAYSDLPCAQVRAFSIDDSETTEIDDALSVTPIDAARTRVGIHIAAPSLGLTPGSVLDEAARDRMSTLYAPGLKTTMLPKDWVEVFSLDEGVESPVVSLYATVDNETLSVISTETRLERLKVEANLRYDLINDLVTDDTIASGKLDIPFGAEIVWLWHFARALLKIREETRGRPEQLGKIDWYFSLKGSDENAGIELKGRRRGDPLDLLVAELMIFANVTWGAWLEETKTAGIYRTQHMGRVKMSSVPAPHDSMGVPCYAWSTSPLRRYVDMVNQRQIISALKGEKAPLQANDTELFAIISAFDNKYTTFNEFQTRMNCYWSMRWIEQEGISEIKAAVVKGDLVRIEGLPMMQRVPGLPELPRGKSVLMRVINLDYVDLVMECSLVRVLDESIEELDEEEEMAQEEAPSESQQAPGSDTGEEACQGPASQKAPE